MSKLTKTKTWLELITHQTKIANISLRDFFKNSNRFTDFSIEIDDILLDFSKNIISEKTMKLLIKLAHESSLKTHIEDMFNGKNINWT
tara:strand:- start:226 stop:489 length:264 start_codon:yes stop_codon:yes gene_type:complete